MHKLAEDDYVAISKKKMHKDEHGAKEMQLKLSHQLFNCDDAKGYFDEDRKIGYGICGMKMLKQKTRETNWKDHQKPREKQQKPLKTLQLNCSCEAEEKSLYRKGTKSTK